MNQREQKKRERYYNDELAMPSECDPLCRFRRCYSKYENKGAYSPGRGYTSYHSTFHPACAARMAHGCGDARQTYDQAAALEWVIEKLESKSAKDRCAAMAVLRAMSALTRGEG